jgi:ParB family chromosome partitioning protein
MGHARALLGLGDWTRIEETAKRVVAGGLSVRATEALVRRLNEPPRAGTGGRASDIHTRRAEERLRLALGTRVRIVRRGKRGHLQIDFVSEDELQRLYEYLTARR